MSTISKISMVAWSASAFTVASIVLFLCRQRNIRGGDTKDDDATGVPTEQQDDFATLEWARSNDTHCFCRPTIRFNLEKLEPTSETIAAIFGLLRAHQLCLHSQTDGTILEPLSNGTWPIQAGKTYQVKYASTMESPCRIGEIFSFLGNKDQDNNNNNKIEKLSIAFYTLIWNDDQFPEFQTLFTTSVANPKEAADHQARWLTEMWGGPCDYTSKFGSNQLVTRMLSKHSSKRRMTFAHACTWLDYMNRAINQVYGNDLEVKLVLGLYWRHFFAFFPLTDEERIGIRKRALSDCFVPVV
jgi:truncated hemoglobin YjbI